MDKNKHADHFLDLSFGGGFRGMRKRALIGCISHSAAEKETDKLMSKIYIQAFRQGKPKKIF